MTPELKKLLLDNAAAHIAYANGEDVEFEFKTIDGIWKECDSPISSARRPDLCWHRIKRAPKLRPFTLEELPLDAWYRVKANKRADGFDAWIKITKVFPDTMEVVFRKDRWSLHGLFDGFECRNNVTGEWGPCGVEVDG